MVFFPKNQIPINVKEIFSQLNTYLAQMNWSKNVHVIGEATGIKKSGNHLYFYLKDNTVKNSNIPKINCRSFYFERKNNHHYPSDGELLIVSGSLCSYQIMSDIYINVKTIELAGQGDIRERLEKLRLKLQSEGLFDESRKRPIPKFPRVVGLVTSSEGKALGDIVKIFRENAPHVELWLVPSLVQGVNAPASMIRALSILENMAEVDTIILGRGGGSSEDLIAFNDESLVRTVASCTKPIVTAIGHDGDNSLCDLVADVKASTPTNAASIVLPNRQLLKQEINRSRTYAINRLIERLDHDKTTVQNIRHRCQLSSPQRRMEKGREQLELFQERIKKAILHTVNSTSNDMDIQLAQIKRNLLDLLKGLSSRKEELKFLRERALQQLFRIVKNSAQIVSTYRELARTLNPRQALFRGYSFVKDQQGNLVNSVSSLVPDQELTVILGDGTFTVKIQEIHPNKEEEI